MRWKNYGLWVATTLACPRMDDLLAPDLFD